MLLSSYCFQKKRLKEQRMKFYVIGKEFFVEDIPFYISGIEWSIIFFTRDELMFFMM